MDAVSRKAQKQAGRAAGWPLVGGVALSAGKYIRQICDIQVQFFGRATCAFGAMGRPCLRVQEKVEFEYYLGLNDRHRSVGHGIWLHGNGYVVEGFNDCLFWKQSDHLKDSVSITLARLRAKSCRRG